jgi:carbamoyl-phosphate synthase small subunit
MNSVICTDGTPIEELKAKLAAVPDMKGLASAISTKNLISFGNENATYKIAAFRLRN